MSDDDPQAILADVIGDARHLAEVVKEQSVPQPGRAILTTQIFIAVKKLEKLQEILSAKGESHPSMLYTVEPQPETNRYVVMPLDYSGSPALEQGTYQIFRVEP